MSYYQSLLARSERTPGTYEAREHGRVGYILGDKHCPYREAKLRRAWYRGQLEAGLFEDRIAIRVALGA
jgi:ribosome modulation factor